MILKWLVSNILRNKSGTQCSFVIVHQNQSSSYSEQSSPAAGLTRQTNMFVSRSDDSTFGRDGFENDWNCVLKTPDGGEVEFKYIPVTGSTQKREMCLHYVIRQVSVHVLCFSQQQPHCLELMDRNETLNDTFENGRLEFLLFQFYHETLNQFIHLKWISSISFDYDFSFLLHFMLC